VRGESTADLASLRFLRILCTRKDALSLVTASRENNFGA
jgi:hypothetical protein